MKSKYLSLLSPFLAISFLNAAPTSLSLYEIGWENTSSQESSATILFTGVQPEAMFPQKFNAQDIKSFYTEKKAMKPEGSYSVGADFNTVMPYSFQWITGTYEKIAKNISFKGAIYARDGDIIGKYTYSSPYTSWNNGDFEVVKNLGTLKFFNLSDSVLGDNDFISSPGQPVKDASFFYIANTDERFVRETGDIRRLNKNVQSFLLILNQLKGENIYGMSEEERNSRAEELYSEYRDKNKYKLSSTEVLDIEEYVKIIIDLRTKILGHFGLNIEEVPSLEQMTNDHKIKLFKGKLFFAVIRGES